MFTIVMHSHVPLSLKIQCHSAKHGLYSIFGSPCCLLPCVQTGGSQRIGVSFKGVSSNEVTEGRLRPPPPQAVKERAWFGKTWRKQGSKEELDGNRARTAGRTVAAGRQLYGTLFSFFRSIFFFVSKGAATAFYSKLTELAANDLDLEKRKAQGCWYCKRGVGRQKIRLGGSGRVVNNHLVRWRSSVFQTVKSCSLFF